MTTAPRSETTSYAKIGPNVYAPVPATTLARAARDAEYLKPSEIATRLRVCKMTVYRLIESGEIPGAIRVGRSLRVPLSAFEAYLEAAEIGR